LSSRCPYGIKIYWDRVNGKPKAFEDKSKTQPHICNCNKKRNQFYQKVIPLEELIEGHTKLFPNLIQRIEDLEKWRDSHEQSSN